MRTKLRFLVKPEDAQGFMPYVATGSGHVQLSDEIVYFEKVYVDVCNCHFFTDSQPCGYYVWECTEIRVEESPCEA